MRRALAKSLGAAIEERFVISVKTDNSGTSNVIQFTLPWIGTYDVDWGDGNTDTGVVDTQTHTYASSGTYDVKVTATTGRIYFNNSGDKSKLLDIKNWGTCTWTTMVNAFNGCNSLTYISSNDAPNLTNVSNVSGVFRSCTNLTNANANNWDVSNVQNFQSFSNNNSNNLVNYNDWNTSNATNLAYAFYRNNISSEFNAASWDISNVSNFTWIMQTTNGMTNANYDATLVSWAAQTPQLNQSPNFGNSQYTLGGAAEAARNTLINTYGWTITDGGGV